MVCFQADLNDIRDEVKVAKKLPEPTITRTEYELKDELVRQTIMDTQEDVQDIKHKLERIEDHIMNQWVKLIQNYIYFSGNAQP